MTEKYNAATTEAIGTEELENSWFNTFTIFARRQDDTAPVKSEEQRAADATELRELVEKLAAGDEKTAVTVRGFYDVSGMRADADVMVWMYSKTPEALQDAIRAIRRTGMFAKTTMVFSAMGADRMAEFNKEHIPAFAMGRKPRKWLCFYPFVRSYDWYTMDPAKRRELLKSHGQLGQEFPEVWANTTSAFAMNDYEWLLGLEAPRLDMLVDMMRYLRNNETRHYVREEIPFYTGHYVDIETVGEVLA